MIPVCKPCWGPEVEAAMIRTARSGRLVQGPEVQAFEEAVAEFTGVRHAVACSSGTTALHLGLMAMGVVPGDEVLIPAFTFVATANAVLACGAQPVLCDIWLKNYCMSLRRVSAPPQWVVPVHAFGVLSTIRSEIVLEDAACALGSFKGLRGRAATLSFHATKIITTGEGGMVLTDDAGLAERCRFLRDQKHGQGMAYNYRMTEIQGAIGREQMRRLPWILKRRADIAGTYDLALDGKIRAVIPPAGNYQSYVLLLDQDVDRVQIIRELAVRGIEALPGTQYLGDMPHLADGHDYPNARRAGTHAMRIPCYPAMTPEAVAHVIKSVLEVLHD